MLYPTLFNDSIFDDLMNFQFPKFPDFDEVDRKLYGKHAPHVMKTDVHDKEDHFEVYIDVPGFKMDEIQLQLENGYLTVSASKNLEEDDKTEKGKIIRQERYVGSMQRSFYVGKNVTEEDVKAKFEDGVLKLNVPKKEAIKIPEKKIISIEG